jgi:hypothetical protein
MTLGGCLTNKMNAGKVSQIKGKRAKEDFEKLSKGLIDSGVAPNQAYAQAAQTVADQIKREAAASKHRLMSRYATQKALIARVDKAKSLRNVGVVMMDQIDFERRAELDRAHSIVGEFIQKHSPNLLGKQSKPMAFNEVIKAKYGEPTTDLTAKAYADALNEVDEYFRKELNRYGHNIAKLDGRGMTHQHNSIAIGQIGKQAWSAKIDGELDWLQMIDPRTGQTFAARPPDAFRMEYLGHVFDNIVYGRDSRTATWGRSRQSGRNLERHRYLMFKNSEAWGRYNVEFGSADPLSTMLSHIDRMAQELAVARHLGHEPETALDYMEQYAMFKARKAEVGEKEAGKIGAGFFRAQKMLRYLGPGLPPTGGSSLLGRRMRSKVMSTARQTLTAALLDRAVIIAVPSDLNSTRLAAQAVGMNPANFLSTYTGLMADSLKGGGMTRDDLLRQGHMAEQFANAAVAMDRYHSEFPAAAWAQNLTNGVMQLSGMNAHTGNLKVAVKQSMAGHFASLKDTGWNDLNPQLRQMMSERTDINQADWDEFRTSDGLFTAQNGATFLDPLYWRTSNTLGNPDRVDELFLKMQTFVEQFTELSVPSGSLIAKSIMDPKASGLMPGSLQYEAMKSMGMFKSFVAAFVVNQVHMVNMTNRHWLTGTYVPKTAYVMEMVGTMMVAGALAIQVGEMFSYRDPQDMSQPDFWARAMLRGGGLGPLGDLLTVGTTTWGGGAEAYVAGPVIGAFGDVAQLVGVNAFDAIGDMRRGESVDTGFLMEARDILSRYTPGAQLPILGQVFDKLVLDQLLLLLDPGAVDAMAAKATRRENLYGNASFWHSGSPLPTRAPDMGNAWSP